MNLTNGHVTWKGLVVVIISIFGIAGTAAGYALGQHAMFPHKGTVGAVEYYGDQNDLKEDIKEIKVLMRSIDEKLRD